MPFDDEKPVEPKKGKIGIKKLGNSIFDNKVKKPSVQEFNQKILEKEDNNIQDITDVNKITLDLLYLFKDKTLNTNKNQFAFSKENEIIEKFIMFCADKNNANEEGSLTGMALLIKLLLEQKNRINELEYSLHNLNKVKPE